MNDKDKKTQSTLSYLTVISEIFEKYNEYKEFKDLVKQFGKDRLINITRMDKIHFMDKYLQTKDELVQREFKFNDSEDRDCTIDVSFQQEKLINFRSNIFFRGQNGQNEIQNFIESELMPLIKKIIGENDIKHDAANNTYYCTDYNGLYITISKLTDMPGISVSAISKSSI